MRVSSTMGALAAAGLVALVVSGAATPLANNDVWIHLTTGGLILDEGEVPRADRYSFTAAGNRYVAHEWLAAAAYALGERAGGTTGVIVAAKLIPALVLLGVLLGALRASGAGAGVMMPLAVLVLVVVRHRILARPELIALALAVGTAWLLLRDCRNGRAGRSRLALLWLVPIAALWANVHGSYPIALVLVGIFAGAQAVEPVLARRDRGAAVVRSVLVAAALGVSAVLAGIEPASFGRAAAVVVALGALLFAADGFTPLFDDPGASRSTDAAGADDRPASELASGSRAGGAASAAAGPDARARSDAVARFEAVDGPGAAAGGSSARSALTLVGVSAAMALAVLANPRGAEIYTFPFEFTSGVTAVTQNIEEWKPLLDAPLLYPSLAFSAYLVFLAVWAGALALGAWRGRLGRLEVAVFLAFAVLPLRHARWMALFTLVTAPALAATIEAARRRPERGADGRYGRAVRLAAALGLAILGAGAVAWATRVTAGAQPDVALRATLLVAAACGALALAAGARRARRTDAVPRPHRGIEAERSGTTAAAGAPGMESSRTGTASAGAAKHSEEPARGPGDGRGRRSGAAGSGEKLRVAAAAVAAAGLTALAAVHGIPEMPGYPQRPTLGVRAQEPIAPVGRLRRHGIEGRLFTEYEWAGYAIHELWPDVKVYLDSRSEVYGDAMLLEYARVKLDRGAAERAIREHGVDLVMVRYEPYPGSVMLNAGILGAVEKDSDWALLHVDDHAVLYARREPERELPPAYERLEPRRIRPGDPANADPALEAEARRAVAAAPGSAFPRFVLALALRAQGRTDEARAELEKAWRSNPRYPGAPQLAGELAVEAGDTEAARRWFRRAQEAYPAWAAPARSLAALQR